MSQTEQMEKIKNRAVSLAIIIAALVVAYNIYNSNLIASNSLKAQISEEEKKNVELEKIGKLDKKVSAYKKLLSNKDASEVMDEVVGMAKSAGVKISSIKPSQEESSGDYIKSYFDINVSVPGYENLGKFINILETSENVYMVENVSIGKMSGQDDRGLSVSLRISLVTATLR